ncbi:hypothetical protein DICSQDRAFT_137441 [Dichomitus squalens LYAD-421 SS1]|uniref:DUF1793-domain-containing protein n=1 Tax=Dichomitus squalens (strain LYAD-421) TaxID=732165 RepID=R7SWA4_DICSQ|nr:uncharacterized protein DICSQDRAFT_137441 [Dichomitus squalens LYAD-421 SS1]EJF60361.1 hypothetical protein DICSQDRAFT_137441 [Dichomitus squalens LYAD-421 SS1]
MRLLATSLFIFNAVTALGAATWNAEPFNPPSVPLAVRSPYLSAWLAQGQGTALNDAWPTFWTGSILGWAGLAKVDGQAYIWMGQPGIPNVNIHKATQKSLQFTSTQSVFVMTAGLVDLTITFLSPIEPSDFVNQSLPLSYYSVSAASTDGKSHSVQVYADISAEWVSGDDTLIVNWATTTGDVLSHEVKLDTQTTYTKINDRIQQGSAFHSTLNTAGATFQTGEDVVVRAQFATNGTLLNTQDTSFRAVSDRWPVFAFAHDLGAVASATTPVVYSIGHVRDPVVQYIIMNADTQARSSYFWARFASIGDAILTFLNDYPNALARANVFDAQVKSDASKISADYASLVALSIRQVFGATEITVTSGLFDSSNMLMFMKGVHYPNATGHNDGKDEAMPVEESGNMLIMTLSCTQRTGDLSLIKTYFSLLDQWTQFLITDSLIPANQLSTDDFAGALANQTNLAIKGIIGIQAMAEIAKLNDDEARASNYSIHFFAYESSPCRFTSILQSIAASYVQQWQKLATSSDGSHLTLSVHRRIHRC